jgi:hypothetical protein
MLSGVGQLAIITRSLDATSFNQNIFFPGQFFNFDYNIDSQVKEAKAWSNGKRVTVSSAVGEETYTLALSFQYLDWFHLGFAYDEIPQKSTNIKLPILKSVILPSTAPFEITDTDISTTNGSGTMAYVSQRGNWGEAGYRKLSAGAVPAVGEFAVNTADKKLIFNAADAGAPVQYFIQKTFASLPSIGYETVANGFGSLSFVGIGRGPEFPNGVYINIPSATRKKSPSLATGDVPEFQLEFGVNVLPGNRSPHQFFLL